MIEPSDNYPDTGDYVVALIERSTRGGGGRRALPGVATRAHGQREGAGARAGPVTLQYQRLRNPQLASAEIRQSYRRGTRTGGFRCSFLARPA